MKKIVIFRLKSISYSEQNIGPNFRILFQIGTEKSELSKKLAHGKKIDFSEEIFQIFTDNETSQLDLKIDISESDPLLDDIGSQLLKIKIGDIGSKQDHLISVRVDGRGWEIKKLAQIKILIETKVETSIRYVSDTPPDGWLKARLKNSDTVSLPYMLKVSLADRDDKREHFVIEEGHYRNQQANVLFRGPRSSYLQKGRHLPPSKLVYSLSKQTLTITGLGKFKTDMDVHNPIPVGNYEIEIPDAPHHFGTAYTRYSKYSKTWFRIGNKGDRYLHSGIHSAGCITVTEKRKWTKIYSFLIAARLNSQSVGILKVVR